MFAVSHMVVGGAIADRVRNPYIALPIAFSGHFALDAIPHTDAGSIYPGVVPPLWFSALNGLVLVGVLALFLRTQTNRPYAALGMFAAILPDWIAGLGRVFPSVSEFSGMRLLGWLHYTYHPSLPGSEWPLGVSTQVVVVALAFVLAYRRRAVRS